MSGWRETTLGEVLTLQRGFDLTEKTAIPGPYPVISSGGYSYTHSEAKARGPGVVTGRKGVLGKVHYCETDYWPHDTTLWVKDFKGSCPRFIYYFLQTLPLADLDAGASNPTLNRNHAHLLSVRVPDRQTQERIAAVLGSIDDLIRNNLRRIEILGEVVHSVYREWFVHFRFPGHQAVPLVESDLGPIPEGWRVAPLSEFAEATIGGDWGSDEPGGPDWIEAAVIRGVDIRSLLTTGQASPTRRWIKKSSLAKREVAETDVIIEASASIGSSIAGHRSFEASFRVPVVYSNFCKRVRCSSAASARFVESLLNDLVLTDEIQTYRTGSTIPNLNFAALMDSHRMVIPPASLIQDFSKLTDSMHDLRYTKLNGTLRETRDLLLPRLVTGEIDVSQLDLDALVGAS